MFPLPVPQSIDLESRDGDPELLAWYCRHFQLDRLPRHFELHSAQSSGSVEQLATSFACLPYENLTKIIKAAQCGRAEAARQTPREVFAGYVTAGTGGTCFALTATLLTLLRAAGWQAQPILADRRYGPNTHCALIVWIDDTPHLIDPGFLIVRPISLASTLPITTATAMNDLILTPADRPDQIQLYTARHRQVTYRLTYKTAPVDAGQFLRAWDQSYDWDMMHYPVVNSLRAGMQHYLQALRWEIRDRNTTVRHELTYEQLAGCIICQFGIAPDVVMRAVRILKQQGDLDG